MNSYPPSSTPWGVSARSWKLVNSWQTEVSDLLFSKNGAQDVEIVSDKLHDIFRKLQLDEFGFEPFEIGNSILIQVDEENIFSRYRVKTGELMFRVRHLVTDDKDDEVIKCFPKTVCAYADLAQVLSCILETGEFLIVSGGFDCVLEQPIIHLNYGNVQTTQLIRLNNVPLAWRGKIIMHECMQPNLKRHDWYRFSYVTQWLDKNTNRVSRRELVKNEMFDYRIYTRTRPTFPKPSDNFSRATQVFRKLKRFSLLDEDDDALDDSSNDLSKTNSQKFENTEDMIIFKPEWKKQSENHFEILKVFVFFVIACFVLDFLLKTGQDYLKGNSKSYENMLQQILEFVGLNTTYVEEYFNVYI